MGAKKRARDSGIPFDIEVSDIVIPAVCPILGKPLVRHTPYAASVDRIVPALGYVKRNIQIISKKANAMKLDASFEELISFANWILNGKNPSSNS